MSNLCSIGTGNWLTAGTWGLVSAVAGTYINGESGPEVLTTSYAGTRSQAFTPGAITVWGIAVKLANRTGTTGTMSVTLEVAGVVVAGTEVTINCSDLQAAVTNDFDGGWIVLKFATPVTLVAAIAHTLAAKTSSATQISLFRDGTTDNLSRMLITSTTQAPVAGDDVVVAGNYTGAGTSNSITVTMDCAATTDHGSAPTAANSLILPGVAVGAKGTLTFKDTSAANPYLKVSNSVIVYNSGTLNIGKSATVTITIATPGVVTWTAHALIADQIVKFATTGALPTGLTALVEYFVVGASITVNTFQVSATAGGAAIDTTGSQSGAHTGMAPIPRDSVAVLEFDPAADGDYGLIARQGSTLNIQGLSRTSGKNIVSCKLNTDEAINSTSLGVDTDTGWLDNDQIAVASTTRTAAQSELGALNGNAGASSLTVDGFAGAGGGLAAAHSGTSPTQAEVINITRNVKVRSATSTIMAYVFCDRTSTVDIDWAQFYYLGENGGNKRGIEVATTTGAFSMQFSSIHDCEDFGFFILNALANNITFSNNVMWNLATVTGPGCQISQASSGTSIVIDSNILIKTGAGSGWTLSDVGGTFTNNVVVSATAQGIQYAESALAGTISGNITHSGASSGQLWAVLGIQGSFSSLSSWRNAAVGFQVSGGVDLVIDSPVAFGNTTDNFLISGDSSIRLVSPDFDGDTTFSTTNGIRPSVINGIISLIIDNGDFSNVSGIKAAHTNDINISNARLQLQALLRNTSLAAATEVATPGNLSNNSWISSQKHDQTAGVHKTWMRYGILSLSATDGNPAPAMLMTPNSSSSKLESAPQFQGIKFAVANGNAVTVSVNINKSAAYNGNQPRLIVKANPALGINSDAVLDTATVGTATDETLSGTTATVSDDGVLEFVVDCDGTAGTVEVDNWSSSDCVDPAGAQAYWFNGLPFPAFVRQTSSGGGISRARAQSGF